MAGDWIKMRTDIFTHPKVVRIASALKADTLRTVGGLMSVWCLFDAHSEDGHLEGYTPEVLDDHLRWDGFAQAMMQVGWLDHDPARGLALPRFDTHNGQSAKRRAQDAERKREVRKTSAPEADKMRTREEKRREDTSSLRSDVEAQAPAAEKPGKAAKVEKPVDVQPEVWLSFLTVRKAKRAPVTEIAMLGIRREAVKAGVSLNDALAVCAERGWAGFKAEWVAQQSRPATGQSFRERDAEVAAQRFAEMAGRAPAGTVIDVTAQQLEIGHDAAEGR